MSPDTHICVVQMYLEGHSPGVVWKPASFKFNDNSFMQKYETGQGPVGWRTEVSSYCALG